MKDTATIKANLRRLREDLDDGFFNVLGDVVDFAKGDRTPNAMPTDWHVTMKTQLPNCGLVEGQAIGKVVKLGKHCFVPQPENEEPEVLFSRNTREDAVVLLLAMAM